MGLKRFGTDKIDHARRLRATGMPPRDVGKVVGASESWVKKVCKDVRERPPAFVKQPVREAIPPTPALLAELASPAEPPAPPASAPPVAAPAEPGPTPRTAEGALTLAYASYDSAAKLAHQAAEDGNTTAAARAQALMGSALEQIRKLSKQLETDTDVVSWPREVHRAAMASVKERVQALCNVPLMCTQCQREFRVAIASAGQEDTDAAKRTG
jgi:hypothetical protein